MNENNITIKVRLSDEDYHDISIDWSDESFDFKKQLFHQLSAYTGIPIIHQACIDVDNVNLHRCEGLMNAEFKNGDVHEYYGWKFDTKEDAMNALQDGDCFLLHTELKSGVYHPGIYCTYKLVHWDLVSETGCNFHYCHYLGSRPIIERFTELVNSDSLQKAMDEAGLTMEERNRTLINLNIKHFTELKCSAKNLIYPGSGWRIHSDYLRYRG
ncbi:uncharacterized protein LOC107368054 [Tetranychus urticae]|uniref:uncharacterized protein LOC107368054 n=1 Tax=Tetranychus urticae TaxID=32264 RepID=UPI000D64681B|nr:uncharacterized protein LOC107368054 [Tetranychus urticae]